MSELWRTLAIKRTLNKNQEIKEDETEIEQDKTVEESEKTDTDE